MECPICGAQFGPDDLKTAGIEGDEEGPVSLLRPFDLALLPCGCYMGHESHARKDRR